MEFQQTQSISSQNIDSLFEWLKLCGASGLDLVEMKPSAECFGCQGCFAKINFKKGDILAKIPKKCLIGLGDALNSDIVQKLKLFEDQERKENEENKQSFEIQNDTSLQSEQNDKDQDIQLNNHKADEEKEMAQQEEKDESIKKLDSKQTEEKLKSEQVQLEVQKKATHSQVQTNKKVKREVKNKKNKTKKENKVQPQTILTNEFMLWVFMSQQLIESDVEGKFNFKPYLKSLPTESPISSSWEEEILEAINETNLGTSCINERQLLQEQINFLRKAVNKGIIDSQMYNLIEWSKGNYLSRRFVGRLANNGEGVGQKQYGGSMGCMVPFFDLLNHKHGYKVNFQHDSDYVWYVCEEDIQEGQEIFNNYCFGSNEQLIFTYGFAIQNNEKDEVLLKMMGQDRKGNIKEIGVFSVDRKGISKDLIKAISQQPNLNELNHQEINILLQILNKQKTKILTANSKLDELFQKIKKSGTATEKNSIKDEQEIIEIDNQLMNNHDAKINNFSVRVTYLLEYIKGQEEVIENSLKQLENLKVEVNIDQYGLSYH